MDKRGFLGKIILVLALIILISSVLIYYKYTKNNFEIKTPSGNIVVDFDVNLKNVNSTSNNAPATKHSGDISIVDQVTRGHKFVPTDMKKPSSDNKQDYQTLENTPQNQQNATNSNNASEWR